MSIIALVRMPMLATAITLPFTFSPMNYKKRIWIALAVIVGGLILFYTPRMQEMMFYSGEGRLSDLAFESEEIRDAGRRFIWDIMKQEIGKRPWLGHGSNASEELVLSITGYSLTHPHNDWLRLEYDYGYIGMGVFILCMLAQVVHAFLMARKSSGESRILFYACASSFVPFLLIMFTDNIILYAAFFGNLQFTMLGLAYSAYHWAQAYDHSRAVRFPPIVSHMINPELRYRGTKHY
jgi:O-antigen ligase